MGSVLSLAGLLFAFAASAQTSNMCVVPPAGLVSWWPGDGDANDIQNGNHGGLLNGATISASGQVGQAFGFADIDDVVVVPDATNLRFGTTDFSIDAWGRLNNTGFSNDVYVAEKLEDNDDFQGYFLRWLGTRLQFGAGDCHADPCATPTRVSFDRFIEATITRDTEWHHYAAVRRGTSLELYYDGQLVASASFDSAEQTDSPSAFSIGNGFVGARRLPDNGWPGLIDEVEVFNRALSAAEIAAIHGAGNAGKCKLKVDIDIKPGSDPNSINQSSAGVIPVAILSSASFDATTVVPESIDLAGASVKLVGKNERPLCHQEDVNADGLWDLVCQVYTWQFLVEEGTDKAVLRGQTSSGLWIWGEDSVRIVPD